MTRSRTRRALIWLVGPLMLVGDLVLTRTKEAPTSKIVLMRKLAAAPEASRPGADLG